MDRGCNVASITALVGALVLSGCVSMAGVGGTSEYSCKAQPGVRCESVSGTYHNALRNNLPGQRPASARRPDAGAGAEDGLQPVNFGARVQIAPEGAGYAAETLRSAPRVLRLWVKPWEDADGDLVDQSYVYVEVDRGRWRIDHVRREQRDAFAPVFAPRGAPAPAAASAPSARPASTAPAPASAVSGPLANPPGKTPGFESGADPFGAAAMVEGRDSDAANP